MKTLISSFRRASAVAIAMGGMLSAIGSDVAAAEQAKMQHLRDLNDTPEGIAASDWSTIRAAYEAQRQAIVAVDGGYEARNQGQQWLTRFDGRGFVTRADAGGWQWGLELESYGFAGNEQRLGSAKAEVKAEGQRVTYTWDGNMREWFVNDGRGLEQGFTIHERPASADARNSQPSTLNLSLAVRGDLRAEVAADGKSVRFVDGNGGGAVNYGGLKVWDADGKMLPAKFSAKGRGISILVDERGAHYPITVDPVAQQAYLKASNTGFNDEFGYSVAISGDTVVIGAPEESSNATGVNGNQADNSADESGAAYVFVRSGTTWTQQAYLKASNTGVQDQFGISVAISGDTVVIGANGESSNATGVNGNQADNSAANAGAAYVFVRNGTTWTQQAYLKASNTGAQDQFGYSMAISGDTVVIGAKAESSNATGVNGNQADNSAGGAGAAYVFVRSGTTWAQQAYLKASNTAADKAFGWSVAISGDSVVIGAPFESSNAGGSGAAYVFVRSGTTWAQQVFLKASNAGADDFFGFSVAISGDTVVIGAPSEESNATGVNGNQADNSAGDAGAAYVFVRNGTIWGQQAYLKASNTDAQDGFGGSVAISGDLVVVGALAESSNAAGVNGNQADNSASIAGAAYLFLRKGTTWAQQAYLKGSNPESVRQFGYSVAISGGTVVVGANAEKSNATGVNGDQGDNSFNQAGAAYTFIGAGPVTPIFSTRASPETTLGEEIHDTALISGGDNPIGTITFNGYGPDDATCGSAAVFTSVVQVFGNGSYSSAFFTPATPGTYRFIATYSGDQFNRSVTTACNDSNESVAVNPAPAPTPTPTTPTPTPTASPTPTPTPTPTSELQNISTRLRVDVGDKRGIGGFIITGAASKRVIIRGLGPSLTQFGISGVLADPVLELHGSSGQLIVTNDNWRDTQEPEIKATGIPPLDDRESAIVATLPAGDYTTILAGKNNSSGTGLIEVYDLDQAGAASRLGNISTRGDVGTDNNVTIGGFILGSGSNNANVVIRGLGPSLSDFGVPNPLADPTLELRNSDGALVSANDNWQDDPSQAALVTASGLAPKDDRESALVANLPAGRYTALLAGKNGLTGIGLVEIYRLQSQ